MSGSRKCPLEASLQKGEHFTSKVFTPRPRFQLSQRLVSPTRETGRGVLVLH